MNQYYFPQFTKLPAEIQAMIWSLLLNDAPSFFEITNYDARTNEYFITGEGSDILSVCGPHNPPADVRPIYLPRGIFGDQMPAPIYIRPSKDTLYIPYPEQLDTMEMAKMKENQCLRYIAIISSAFDSLTLGAHMVYSTSALPLLSGLKNLHTMFVIDGYAKGLEDWENRSDRTRQCVFEIEDVKVGHTGRTVQNASFWEVWTSAHVDLIRKCFRDEEERIRLLQMEWDRANDSDWRLPEIVGKTLWRRMLEPLS